MGHKETLDCDEYFIMLIVVMVLGIHTYVRLLKFYILFYFILFLMLIYLC